MRKYLTYDEAKEYMKQQKICTHKEWNKWKKGNRPLNIPKVPEKFYKEKGWISWTDFLSVKEKCISYFELKQYIKKLSIQNCHEWEKYVKNNILPDKIPTFPSYAYEDEWEGWINICVNKYPTYEDCKKMIEPLKIFSSTEWEKRALNKQIPKEFPYSPYSHYKRKGTWKGWNDFLGLNYRNYKINDDEKFQIGKLIIDIKSGQIKNIYGKKIGNVKRDGYVSIYTGKQRKQEFLHRVIYKLANNIQEISKGIDIDHINSNPSDNRIENLQALTKEQHYFKNAFDYYMNKPCDINKIKFWDSVNKKYIKIKNLEFEEI